MSATIGVSIVPGQTALMRIPRGRVFQRGALGQAEHAVLGGVVGGASGVADQAAKRRAVHDRPTALLAHLAQLVLHARPDAAQVDGGDAVEAVGQFVGRVSERQHDAGVVEGHVEPAELADGAIDERADLILVGDIACDAQDPMALGTQLVGRGAQRLLVDIGEHHGGAARGERAGGVEPMPPPAPVTSATWPRKSYVGFMRSGRPRTARR